MNTGVYGLGGAGLYRDRGGHLYGSGFGTGLYGSRLNNFGFGGLIGSRMAPFVANTVAKEIVEDEIVDDVARNEIRTDNALRRSNALLTSAALRGGLGFGRGLYGSRFGGLGRYPYTGTLGAGNLYGSRLGLLGSRGVGFGGVGFGGVGLLNSVKNLCILRYGSIKILR